MSKNLEEKFIEERLKHEKSERDLFEQLQQLKAENDKLKKENEKMYKIGCGNFVVIDQAKRLYKLNKCIDEIGGIINFISSIKNCDSAYYCKDKLDEILQLIKQAKEGEE